MMNAMFPFPFSSLLPGPWRVLGLMSGTSADGTDAVLVEIDPNAYASGQPFRSLLGHLHQPYPSELQTEVLLAAADELKPSLLCKLQTRLGEAHALAGRSLIQNLGVEPHFASLHGQTVQHWPGQGATLQLADPYPLSEALGCPVVWDLRRRDMAVGGQGAPLVPLTELWLHGRQAPWAALNLGGIANITLWDGESLMAWDLGPAMSLLDLAAQRWLKLPFDPDGQHATGMAEAACLERWLTHPYFQRRPPKSTGRETFGQAWLAAENAILEGLSLEDRLATLAAFSAESCAREIGRWGLALPPGTPLLLSGGGALHLRLRQELTQRLPDFQIRLDLRFPSGAREAVSWALLGAASAAGIPGNLPQATGARSPVVLGSWTL